MEIRAVRGEDGVGVALVYGPYVTHSPASFETTAPDGEEMRDRIMRITEMYPWLVAVEDGRVEGYAYLNRHRERRAYQWAVDATVYLRQSSQRRGIGRRLYTELFNIARRQGFTNVFAGITLPNEASVGLHKAMGFELVGIYERIGFKHGRWHDTSWWQLRLQDILPVDPISWRELEIGPFDPF